MKMLKWNIIGLLGFGSLMSGTYLQFGLSILLMFGGSVLIIATLLAFKAGSK